MGKYDPSKVNPNKKKKNKGGKGPCGLKYLSKKCKSTKRDTNPKKQCNTSCGFNNKKKKKTLK